MKSLFEAKIELFKQALRERRFGHFINLITENLPQHPESHALKAGMNGFLGLLGHHVGYPIVAVRVSDYKSEDSPASFKPESPHDISAD